MVGVTSSSGIISEPEPLDKTLPAIKTVIGPYVPPRAGQYQPTVGNYYGVYFYPYTAPGVDPVFAVVGQLEILVARPDPQKGFEIIQLWKWDGKDDDEGRSAETICSGCWTKDKITGVPLLCVGGSGNMIRVLNIKTGEEVQSLRGHGDEIMELMTSPLDQSLIASCASDHSVRMWSIDPIYEHQPTQLICAGEGHKDTVLSIGFHASGKYLLSGGMDRQINLWVVPDLPNERSGTDNPTKILYPHFSTTLVHTNYVDCVKFHGDFIISRSAKEGKIILWGIQNFNSKKPPPAEAPATHELKETRSAFGEGFDRFLQFEANDTDLFFMRFALFNPPYEFGNPILALGSTAGKIYLWDLKRTETYSAIPGFDGNGEPSSLLYAQSESATPALGTGSEARRASGTPKVKGRQSMDDLSDAQGMIPPHKVLDVPRVRSSIRYIAFSNDGGYMVVVGDNGLIVVCRKAKST